MHNLPKVDEAADKFERWMKEGADFRSVEAWLMGAVAEEAKEEFLSLYDAARIVNALQRELERLLKEAKHAPERNR